MIDADLRFEAVLGHRGFGRERPRIVDEDVELVVATEVRLGQRAHAREAREIDRQVLDGAVGPDLRQRRRCFLRLATRKNDIGAAFGELDGGHLPDAAVAATVVFSTNC